MHRFANKVFVAPMWCFEESYIYVQPMYIDVALFARNTVLASFLLTLILLHIC